MEKIGQNHVPFAFDLSGHDAYRFSNQLLNVRLLLAQHVDGAAGVKTADDNGEPFRSERLGHIQGAWKLIGLDANQADQQLDSGLATPTNDFFERDFFSGLVKSYDI